MGEGGVWGFLRGGAAFRLAGVGVESEGFINRAADWEKRRHMGTIWVIGL